MKNMDIRPGDKVRFLNDVGGGEVTRVEGKIIYVEDEIGFEIPMPSSEVLVVERKEDVKEKSSQHGKKEIQNEDGYDPEMPDLEEEEPPLIEDSHDDANPRVYLAFLDGGKPQGDQRVDIHIVNDSNYYCLYLILEIGEDGLARQLFNGRIQPNTKEFLDGFSAAKMDTSWHVQIILYRNDKPFRLLEPVNEIIKIRANKFFRENAFKSNDFFYDNVVLLPIIKTELERQVENLTKKETRDVLKEKGELVRKKPSPEKQKRPDIIEVDLHIHELLDDIRGLSNADMLKIQMDKFHEVMEENLKNKGQKIVFIHGIGNGTLKHEVRRQLNTRYKSHSFQDASFREYGYGATLVII